MQAGQAGSERPPGPGPVTAPIAILCAAVALRVLLDTLWWVDSPLPGTNLPRAASTALAACFAGVAFAHRARLRRHPLFLPFAAFAALLVLGWLRAPDMAEGTRILVLYISPFCLMFAISATFRHPRDTWLLIAAIAVAGAVPLTQSLHHLATGQGTVMLHGYERLVGGYKNLHGHALAMAFLATVGVFTVFEHRERRWKVPAAASATAAAVALHFTYVRTGLLFLAAVTVALLLAARRLRLAAAIGAIGIGYVLSSGVLRDRFSEVLSVVTLTAPDGGWDTLGTGRLGMWRNSLHTFLELGPVQVLLGTGLGGHRTFWKGKNPHNEYLLLLYQLGPAGPLVFLWLLGTALREALAHLKGCSPAVPVARYVAAMCIGVALVCSISNAFLDRATIAWLFWAVAGLLFASPPPVTFTENRPP